MVISDSKLENYLSSGKLLRNADNSKIQPSSYDLRVGTFYKPNTPLKGVGQNSEVIVNPGQMITIHTLEEFDLPNDICAFVYPMNRLSSKGFLVINPGHIDPGFKGPITVVAINVNKNPITIYYEQDIITATFHKLDSSSASPYSSVYGFSPQDRTRKERDMMSLVNSSSIGSIADVINFDGRYVDEQKAVSIVKTHWSSWLSIGGVLLAVIFGILSVYATYSGFAKDSAELQIMKLTKDEIEPIKAELKRLSMHRQQEQENDKSKVSDSRP